MRKHERSAENTKYMSSNIHVGSEHEIKAGEVGWGHSSEGTEVQIMSLCFTWIGK